MMKVYTVKEIAAILSRDDIAASDALTDCFGATGEEMALLITLDGSRDILVTRVQEYDADTEDFYRHWQEITPGMLSEAREKLTKIMKEHA